MLVNSPAFILFLVRFVPGFLLSLILLAPLNDFDTWFHLDMGRWMLEHGTFYQVDNRTFTTFGQPVYNVAWLFQVVLAGVYRLGGLYGILILQIALFTLPFFLFATVVVKNKQDFFPYLLALVCLSTTLANQYTLRPHLVEHFGIAALLVTFYKPARQGKWLVMAAILWIWANSHGSALVGAGMAAIHLTLDEEPRRIWPRHGQRLLLAGVLCLIPFCTPMGLDLLHLLETTRRDITQLNISEWQAPEVFPYFLFIMFAGYLYALLRKVYPFRAAELSFILFYFYQTDHHLRFINELSLVMVMPLTLFFIHCQKELDSNWKPISPLFTSTMSMFMLMYYHPAMPIFSQFPHSYPVDITELPVAVSRLTRQLAQEKGTPLRLLNHYNFGGYLEFDLADQGLHFVDGRASMLFPSALVRENFFAFGHKRSHLRQLAKKWQVDAIIAYQSNAKNLLLPSNDPEWRVVGYDRIALLYVRRDGEVGASWPEIPYVSESLGLFLPEEKLADAVKATTEMLNKAPDNPWAWAQLGILLEKQSRILATPMTPASAALRRGWEKLRTPLLQLHLARALLSVPDSEAEIMALLKELPETLPKSSAPFMENLAAEIHLALSQYKAALNRLAPTKIGQKDQLDQFALTWWQRHQAWSALGDIDRAVEAMSKAKQLAQPNHWPPGFDDPPPADTP
ncbi:MAG: hypothetical protein H7839_03490 [Magnetococcus sp. YQC-5]